MSKPSWEDAPIWATHLTLDDDGSWVWHDQKPVQLGGSWSSPYHRIAGYEEFEPICEERP